MVPEPAWLEVTEEQPRAPAEDVGACYVVGREVGAGHLTHDGEISKTASQLLLVETFRVHNR